MFRNIFSTQLKKYKYLHPDFKIDEYFNGVIKGSGIMQNWRGQVVERFDIEMVGEWNGNSGKLIENFHYYDGTKNSQRIWNIQKLGNNKYEATAHDISGKARGITIGNSARWNYHMLLPPNTKRYSVKFDDWMWLMNDEIVINRSYLSKFWLPVGQITILMKRDLNLKQD